jgi:hypothetical protein
MITLPPGFDVSVFVSDLFAFVVPFASIALLVGIGYFLVSMIRRA